MKEKKYSICDYCILMINGTWILYGFCFIFLIILFLYPILNQKRNISLLYSIKGKENKVSLVPEINQTINIIYQEMCTTKWYKQLYLEFNVFSVENFKNVKFIMDNEYRKTIENGLYRCIFFQFGTNKKLKPRILIPIGGRTIYDPLDRTLILECSIPIEAIHPQAMTINFLLISQNNYANAVNISICRSYNSSYSFINSRIYLENRTELKFENKNVNKIAVCTQTSHHNSFSSLWINYHYKMGINHFYIYDHAPFNETNLHKNLKSYIDLNIVTIIPWHVEQWNGFKYHGSSSEWISHQIWSQNDCIHRYGYLYSWILISDVDEFIVPMGKYKNFNKILDIIPSKYCALQVFNYDFKGLQNSTPVTGEDRPKKYIHRERNHKGRDTNSKNFVRPQLIYYFAVHQVTKSKNKAPVFYANAKTHARLQHYRSSLILSEQLSNFVVDTHILQFIDQLNNSVSSIVSR